MTDRKDNLTDAPLEPRFAVWLCDHCRNGIEFDVVQLAGRAECRVACPHCGQETSLQEPPPLPKLVPDEGWALPAAAETPEVPPVVERPKLEPAPVESAPPEFLAFEEVMREKQESIEGLLPGHLDLVADEPILMPTQMAEPPPPVPSLPPVPPVSVIDPVPPPLKAALPQAPPVAPANEPKAITVNLPPDPPPPVLTRAPVDVRWLTDLGVVYFRQHQFQEAFLCFSRAAQQGFATAQFCLAVCHLNGQGTGKDETAALPWLEKAAAQGDANAEFTLGMAYRLGHAVVSDEEMAMQWLRKAAARGHGEAIKAVGAAVAQPSAPKENPATPPVPLPAEAPAKGGQVLQRLLLGLFRKK